MQDLFCARVATVESHAKSDGGVKIRNSAAARRSILAIAAFVCALSAQEPPASERSVWDGVYTEEQAKRGEALYEKQCSTCHGDKLAGRESAPPLTGGAFMANWNGLTLGDLFERIRRTMPQDAPGKLSRQQNADVLAYVLNFNKFPAGKTELYRQAEMLKEIRFEAAKPEAKK
jgi:mono/diheme cytochrome c family protein